MPFAKKKTKSSLFISLLLRSIKIGPFVGCVDGSSSISKIRNHSLRSYNEKSKSPVLRQTSAHEKLTHANSPSGSRSLICCKFVTELSSLHRSAKAFSYSKIFLECFFPPPVVPLLCCVDGDSAKQQQYLFPIFRIGQTSKRTFHRIGDFECAKALVISKYGPKFQRITLHNFGNQKKNKARKT